MNRRKKKNTRANLYRGGDGKSYYEANKRRRMSRYIKVGSTILITLLLALSIMKISGRGIFAQRAYSELSDEVLSAQKPDIDVELLTVNEYSRPGLSTNEITGIVIHYTANPGSTAMENRDYFEGLKDSHITQASSNFVVGLDGEIVQCVPTWEVAIHGILIRCPLSAVIRMRPESSTRQLIRAWYNLQHGCVKSFR